MMKLTNQRGISNDIGPMKFPFSSTSSHSTVHPINKSRNFGSLAYFIIVNLELLSYFCVSCLLELSLGETSRPLNRAAAYGAKVQLNCSTREPYNGYWKYTKPFETTEIRIYDGDQVDNVMKTIFSVNDSVQGSFNLIFNASESTSGRYTCQPDLDTDDQSAEVIVLDTSPNCSMLVTSDIVNASCRIDFNGNWAPKIQWHNVNGRLETNDTTTVRNSRVTSFLIVPANQTDILTCTPTFVLESKPREATATNVPDLLTNCTLNIGSSYASTEQPNWSTRPTATPPSSQLYVIAIVICFVCIIVTAFIAVFLYKRCNWKIPKRSSTMQKHKSETEAMTGSPKVV